MYLVCLCVLNGLFYCREGSEGTEGREGTGGTERTGGTGGRAEPDSLCDVCACGCAEEERGEEGPGVEWDIVADV